MAADVTLSTLSTAGITKYSRKVGHYAEDKMILAQFGQVPEGLELGWKDIVYTRYIPISQGTAPTDVTSAGTYSTSKKTRIQQVKVVPKLYADGETFDLFDVRRMFIQFVSGASKLYGNWLGKQFNYFLTKEVSKFAYHIRNDDNDAYQVSGTVDSGSTTTIVDAAALTQVDDYWNGGYVVMTSGINRGFSAIVSDFDNGTATITVNATNASAVAFPVTVAADDTFYVVASTGIASGDTISQASITRAVALLEKNECEPYEGGMYIGYVDAANKKDLLASMVTIAQYTQTGITKIFKNEVGVAFGVRWIRGFELFRTDADGTEDRTDGVVSSVLIFGKDAFGELPISAASNMPEIIVKTPGNSFANDAAADGNLQGSVAVKGAHAPKLLNALYAVAILTGPKVLA